MQTQSELIPDVFPHGIVAVLVSHRSPYASVGIYEVNNLVSEARAHPHRAYQVAEVLEYEQPLSCCAVEPCALYHSHECLLFSVAVDVALLKLVGGIVNLPFVARRVGGKH